MTVPRRQLIDPEVPLNYHIVSACTRHIHLCGVDPLSGKDYSYRKQRLEQRVISLAACYAVEINAYAIMSNHFHLQIYYDPKANDDWSAEEVAHRWFEAHPPAAESAEALERHKEQARAKLIQQPEQIAHCRKHLGSLSCYMQHLKQPFAAAANKEDNTRGYFFDQRFYSGALLDEGAMIACMAYVDLNPVRAKIVENIAAIRNASISARLKGAAERPELLEAFMQPLVSGLKQRLSASRKSRRDKNQRFLMNLREYLRLLEATLGENVGIVEEKLRGVLSRSASIAKRRRVYGTPEQIDRWQLDRARERLSNSRAK